MVSCKELLPELSARMFSFRLLLKAFSAVFAICALLAPTLYLNRVRILLVNLGSNSLVLVYVALQSVTGMRLGRHLILRSFSNIRVNNRTHILNQILGIIAPIQDLSIFFKVLLIKPKLLGYLPHSDLVLDSLALGLRLLLMYPLVLLCGFH